MREIIYVQPCVSFTAFSGPVCVRVCQTPQKRAENGDYTRIPRFSSCDLPYLAVPCPRDKEIFFFFGLLLLCVSCCFFCCKPFLRVKLPLPFAAVRHVR